MITNKNDQTLNIFIKKMEGNFEIKIGHSNNSNDVKLEAKPNELNHF